MKLDVRPIKRSLSEINRKAKSLAKARDKALSTISRYPGARQRKNREATASLKKINSDLEKVERERIKISAIIDELKACTNICSTECEQTRKTAREIAVNAPPAKKAVKRAKAPDLHTQKLIAQAHWFELMRRADPDLKFPSIPLPQTDWQPDGLKQVNAYRKVWRDVFDSFWWKAADTALIGNPKDAAHARAYAIAAAPSLFDVYEQKKGNVQSLDNQLRKKRLHVPDDPIFFPMRKNPSRRRNCCI